MNMRYFASFLVAIAAYAQPPGRGGANAPIPSPEVATDGRVTFRLRAPNAKEVSVTGEMGRHALLKDDQGMWSVTTDALKPELYTYSFSVDGATVQDPGNPMRKTALVGGGQSILRVPGSASWDPMDVPRGVVSHHVYKSTVIGDDRDLLVYTPPNYDPRRTEPYPVLYLLHGLGDDAASWTTIGAANVILDNLISQGKAKPMIMVNPLGYGTPRGVNAASGSGPKFVSALLDEVVPAVEKAYRASKDRNQRAIAGLSMGGAQALLVGLNHLDKFAWVSSFSGAFVMWPGVGGGRSTLPPSPNPDEAFQNTFPQLDDKANSQLRLLWISCGTADGLNGVNRQFKSWLKGKNLRFADIETPGAHTWSLWRHNLAELAPLLFQSGDK